MRPVYLLSGEEFLAGEALAKVRVEAGADPLSEVSFGPKTAARELAGALDTPSLLGGPRLVVVRDAHDLPKESVEVLARYLEAPPPDAVLVLVAHGRTRLDGAAKKLGALVSLEAPKGRRLASWVRERAKGRDLRADERAAWALIDAVGAELRDLDSALEQMATALGAGARITDAVIKKAFPRHADERIYALTDAVGDRKMTAAMTILRRLFDQGEEPLLLFGALTAHVRRMLRARRAADRGAGHVAEAVGVPGWRAERLARQARSYREEELVSGMVLLARTDVEMKGGDVPPESALEEAVVRLIAGRFE